MLKQQHKNKRFLSKIAAKVLSGWLNPSYINTKTMERDIKNVSKYAYGTMLDIGCGTKPYYSIFQNKVNRYIGLENVTFSKVNPEGVGSRDTDISEIIKTTPRDRCPDIFGNSLCLPLKNDSVDTVLCTEVLEHVPEPQKMMNEIARVLKRDGVLIMTAPFALGHHQAPYDYYRYTKYGLLYLAETSGLKPFLIKPHHGFFALIGLFLSSLLYFDFCRTKTGKPNIFLAIFIIPVCAIIQLVFYLLDKIKFIDGTTKGHILVARKPA